MDFKGALSVHGAPRAARTPQGRPKGSAKGPKGTQKEPKGTPKELKGTPKGPKGIPKEPKGTPKEPKVSPKAAKDTSKTPKGSPKGSQGAQSRPKAGQRHLYINKLPINRPSGRYVVPRSLKSLAAWFADLLTRVEQLVDWTRSLATPGPAAVNHT